MIIAVTGTPGTGKTRLSKRIETFGFKYVDGNALAKKLSEGYDDELMTYVVDEKKFSKAIVDLLKKSVVKKKKADYQKLFKLLGQDFKVNMKTPDVVVDSHLSHFIPQKYVDLVVVTKCSLPELKRRLQKRKYPVQKINDNVEAEIFDVCGIDAREKGHKVAYYPLLV